MDDVSTRIATDRGCAVERVANGGFLCGLSAGEFLAIIEGSVCAEASRPRRNPVAMLLARAGDCLVPWGEHAPGDRRRTRNRALTKVVAVRVPSAAIDRMVREDPSVLGKIFLKFGEEYAELLALLAAVSERNTAQRTAPTVRTSAPNSGRSVSSRPACTSTSHRQRSLGWLGRHGRRPTARYASFFRPGPCMSGEARCASAMRLAWVRLRGAKGWSAGWSPQYPAGEQRDTALSSAIRCDMQEPPAPVRLMRPDNRTGVPASRPGTPARRILLPETTLWFRWSLGGPSVAPHGP